MVNYTWFKIFNLAEFQALDLTSKLYELELENIGPVEVLVTQGETIGMLYDDVFLSLDLNDVSPFAFEGYAIYNLDGDIYLGIEVDES